MEDKINNLNLIRSFIIIQGCVWFFSTTVYIFKEDERWFSRSMAVLVCICTYGIMEAIASLNKEGK